MDCNIISKEVQKKLFHIRIAQPLAFTEVGVKHRNEGAIYPLLGAATHGDILFMACDGIGGLAGGDIASNTVCRSISTYLLNHAKFSSDVSLFSRALLHTYNELNRVPEDEIGSTLTFLKILNGSVFIAHLGDNRVYHIRPCRHEKESISFQTKDHSLVNELIDKGKIARREARGFELNNTITKSIQGHCKKRYNTTVYQTPDIQSGDYFLLCSDEMLEYVTNARLQHILYSDASGVDKMVQIEAICRDRSTDNYSAYLIGITESNLSLNRNIGAALGLKVEQLPRIDLIDNERTIPKVLIGTVAGNIVGSYYEFVPMKSINFLLFSGSSSHFTNDTAMTIANADWLLTSDSLLGIIQDYGNRCPSSYGGMFYEQLKADGPQPYNSWRNGSTMRASPVGWAFNTLEETLEATKQSTEVTHNHPEGIKGTQATVTCIYLAHTGKSKQKIKKYIETALGYDLNRACDEVRPTYYFDESCQGAVPESIIAFSESTDYKSAIRPTISLGGDADTTRATTDGIAEAYYKEIPQYIREEVLKRLSNELIDIMQRFYETFVDKRIIENSI